ncbi:MAG: hypothetical protein JXA07_06955 [Spirochaetes bacterium]|nr:hypothetical protein [Spirochaetota bacterium]
MNRTILAACIALMLSSATPPAGTMSRGNLSTDRPVQPVTQEESDRVIAALKKRGIEMYRTYTGVESLRTEIVREYDPDTGTLKSTSEVSMKRKDYYYKDPDIEVLSYIKDGKEMKPSKFRIMKSAPSFPVFDERGDEHYSITIEDKVKINGKACYRVRVTPRKKTMRHFSGDIFFRTDTLDTVRLEGTVAKLDFPLTSFRIELHMAPHNGVPVLQSGTVEVRVHVPIFYPDTLIVTSIATRESRLMQ